MLRLISGITFAFLTVFTNVEAKANVNCPNLSELNELYEANNSFDENPFTSNTVKWIKYAKSPGYKKIVGGEITGRVAKPGYVYNNREICTYDFDVKNAVNEQNPVQYILYHDLSS